VLLNFRKWILQEAITLQQAAQLYGYNQGDVITANDLKSRFRKLVMQHHPDRGGNAEIAKQVFDGNAVLGKFIGMQLPVFQTRMTPQQRWVQPVYDVKTDIKDELNRAIIAIKKGQPEDAFAAVSRLTDPHMGKLQTADIKPILKTSLVQWLDYYKQGFHDYLEPILVNALKLI
jgi:hypothetical protein